jgi:cell division protein FtsZ
MKTKGMETVKEVVDRMRAPYENLDEPVTLVIGCGGAGNNLVNHFHKMKVEGITTVGINTDERHLNQIEADKKIYIGKTITQGRGAGGHKEIGEQAAQLAKESLTEIVENSDIVFLVAGLGGGTGLGATPVVGRIAKEQGAVVIGICIMPFLAETSRRKKADKGLQKLKKIAESTIILDNNKLLKIAPDLSAEEGLNIMNKMISQVIINTRKTLIQSINATKSLDIYDIMGEFQPGEIEEKKPQIENGPNILAPAPLHADILNENVQNSPNNEKIENNTPDILQ